MSEMSPTRRVLPCVSSMEEGRRLMHSEWLGSWIREHLRIPEKPLTRPDDVEHYEGHSADTLNATRSQNSQAIIDTVGKVFSL